MPFGRSQDISSDPIISSTPPRPTMTSNRVYNSEDDSGDELFNETVPTLLIDRPAAPQLIHNSIKPLVHEAYSPYYTQPTQILETPVADRRSTTPMQSNVQVVASSPPSVPSPAPPRLQTLVAPPGTAYRPPGGTGVKATSGQRQFSQVDLNDLPERESSDEEDDAVRSRADIKPTTFTSGGRPESFGSSFFQRFTYSAGPFIPQKRGMDDLASSYGNSRRPVKVPRQQGPARALPIDDQDELSAPSPKKDIAIEDIPDYEVRKNVQRIRSVLPQIPVKTIMNAVIYKKNNYADAMDYILEMSQDSVDLTQSDDELQQTPKVVKRLLTAKPTARRDVTNVRSIHDKWSSTQGVAKPGVSKREPIAPTRSIQDKWSNTQSTQRKLSNPVTFGALAAQTDEVKPRRRLVQGRRHASPPIATSSTLPSRLKPSARRVIESDDEDNDSGLPSEAESESEEPDEDSSLLRFINACSAKDLADLSNSTEEIVSVIIAKRPFRNLDQVRAVTTASPEPADSSKPKKRGAGKKPKAIGEKIVDVCEEMWSGYEAVDTLVRECEALGKPLADEMKKWGFDVFGASKEGELGLVSLEETKSERDSGIGTPTSSTGDEDVVDSKRTKSTFLKKPSIMAETLELKDYQLVGLNWLNLLWSRKLSCILADDMGLGKTCQVISFLSHLVETGTKGPHLVVVPGSTLENWLREFKNFSPNLNVEPYYGSQKEREEQQYLIEDILDEVNVIVTTYDTAWRPADNKYLRSTIQPVVCVYDEGHMLKNSMAKKHQELMRIKAEFRLLLTGTPLQNNLQELASLLAFIMPDLFANHKEELSYIFKHKAKTTDSDHAALLSAQRIAKARSMMTPFILRRKKHQVLKHLPTKTCRVEYCTMTDVQKKLYEEHLAAQRRVYEARAAGDKTAKAKQNNLMDLRFAAIHPLLFRRQYTDAMIKKMSKAILREPDLPGRDEELVFEDMSYHSDFQMHQLCQKWPTTLSKWTMKKDEWMHSGKVAALVELLKKFRDNGDRTLIFSQFTNVMDILEEVLNTLSMPFFRLDGSTPITKRQDMLDEFYRDESVPVFMLSTKAGGSGINLACANKVIIFDSSFNPQEDVQAENRAHRVGQTREVEVVRLVTKDTVEEAIHALGNSKLALDDRVAGEGATKEEEAQAEKEGMSLVEKMLFIKKEESEKDLKDEFLESLKGKGLDMSKA